MRGWKSGFIVATALVMGASSASGQQAGTRAAASIATGQTVRGTLSRDDAQFASGKYRDVYLLQGRRGERVAIDLHSEDFDSFLLVTGPDGVSLSNDDADPGASIDSRVVMALPADGAYEIAVTSYRPGETGAYQLSASVPARGMAVTTAGSAQPIRFGSSVQGRLATGDSRLASGEYSDSYRFTARRGQRVRIDLAADKFDTYLILRHPDGSQDDNDDMRVENGRPSTNSRIDEVLGEDGEYVVSVTSYRPGETGEYRLAVGQSPGIARQNAVQGGPRVIALLVGVSDYGGRTSNLPNTDDDARRLYEGLRDAGMLHPASMVLTNEQATTKGVEAAFARAAAAAGPNDLFMFFFSGHGNQIDVPVSAAELDGRSETIELRDAAMTDVALGRLFDRVHARMELAVIDSCFAGGFRNLIDRPNVMGLFSSEEDLTSLVASRFQAGGFLAYFLRAGLAGAADADGDRLVTNGELADYIRRRFRGERDLPVETREDERGFQNVLVERGGLRIDDVVVRLAANRAPAPTARPEDRRSLAARETPPAETSVKHAVPGAGPKPR
jgi:hypothetical protein